MWKRRRKGSSRQIGKAFRIREGMGFDSGKVMPFGLQLHKLEGELKRSGIEPDLADLRAEIDPTLSYEENLRLVRKKYALGISKRVESKSSKAKEELTNKEVAFHKEQAQDYFNQRSPKSQEMDLSKKAKTTITDKQIAKDPSMLDKWFKAPNKSDVEGVDDR